MKVGDRTLMQSIIKSNATAEDLKARLNVLEDAGLRSAAAAVRRELRYRERTDDAD